MLDQLTAKELNESSYVLKQMTEVHDDSSGESAGFTRNHVKMDASIRSSVMDEIRSFKDVMQRDLQMMSRHSVRPTMMRKDYFRASTILATEVPHTRSHRGTRNAKLLLSVDNRKRPLCMTTSHGPASPCC